MARILSRLPSKRLGRAVVEPLEDRRLLAVWLDLYSDHNGVPAAIYEGAHSFQTIAVSWYGQEYNEEPIRVEWTVTGTATPGEDFTLVTHGIMEIDRTQFAGSNNLPAFDVLRDNLVEPDEFFTVTLSIYDGPDDAFGYPAGYAPVPYHEANQANVSLTDIPPMVGVWVRDGQATEFAVPKAVPVRAAPTSQSAAGGVETGVPSGPLTPLGDYGEYEFYRTGGDLTKPLTVEYALEGTATDGTDYTGPTRSIFFDSDIRTSTVYVSAPNDRLVEPTETVVVTMEPTDTYLPYAPSTYPAEVRILDGSPKIGIIAGVEATEDGQLGSFHVTRVGGYVNEPLTVYLSPPSGAADAGDFTDFPTQVRFEARQTSVPVFFAARDDEEIEPAEPFTLALRPDPNLRYAFAAPATAAAPPEAENKVRDNDFKIDAAFVDYVSQGVRRDKGEQKVYERTSWSDANVDRNDDRTAGTGAGFPVSFVRSMPNKDSKITADVSFRVSADDPAVFQAAFKIIGQGTGLGNPTLDGAGVFGNGVIAANVEQKNGKLADTIDHDVLSVKWAIERTANNRSKTQDYGTSKNLAYVTGAAVGAEFETVLDIACRNAKGRRPGEQGEAEPAATAATRGVADKVWDEFADNIVKRKADDRLLNYSHNGVIGVDYGGNVAEMLHDPEGEGQCTAWTDLLIDALRVGGVSSKGSRITSKSGLRFRVKLLPAQGSQGQLYTTTDFGFHQVVRIDAYPDSIYDPSYGGLTIKTDNRSVELMWEDDNVVGFLSGQNLIPDRKGVVELIFTPE